MAAILESYCTLEIKCSVNGIEKTTWQKEVLLRWQTPMSQGCRRVSTPVFTEEILRQLCEIDISDVISFEVKNLSKDQVFCIQPFAIEDSIEGVNIQRISEDDIAFLAVKRLQEKLETLSYAIQL